MHYKEELEQIYTICHIAMKLSHDYEGAVFDYSHISDVVNYEVEDHALFHDGFFALYDGKFCYYKNGNNKNGDNRELHIKDINMLTESELDIMLKK